ncbi:MAG: hypothetical protein IMY79_02975 [Chloroflexi bacterium]|nr:hypothetical protein [Chloroflexota bacterium]
MEYDTERAEQKTEELINLAKEAILTYWKSIGFKPSSGEASNTATDVINNLIQVTPPEKEKPALEFIIMLRGGRGGGRSIKPGNMVLNIRKLITAVAGGGLTVVTAVAIPWTAPLAAIVIWDRIWSNLKLELSEREAAIIWTMWMNRDDDNCVVDADLLVKVNSELAAYRRSSISRQELDDALETLKRMRCIERSRSDPSKWGLREWVRVTYR